MSAAVRCLSGNCALTCRLLTTNKLTSLVSIARQVSVRTSLSLGRGLSLRPFWVPSSWSALRVPGKQKPRTAWRVLMPDCLNSGTRLMLLFPNSFLLLSADGAMIGLIDRLAEKNNRLTLCKVRYSFRSNAIAMLTCFTSLSVHYDFIPLTICASVPVIITCCTARLSYLVSKAFQHSFECGQV